MATKKAGQPKRAGFPHWADSLASRLWEAAWCQWPAVPTQPRRPPARLAGCSFEGQPSACSPGASETPPPARPVATCNSLRKSLRSDRRRGPSALATWRPAHLARAGRQQAPDRPERLESGRRALRRPCQRRQLLRAPSRHLRRCRGPQIKNRLQMAAQRILLLQPAGQPPTWSRPGRPQIATRFLGPVSVRLAGPICLGPPSRGRARARIRARGRAGWSQINGRQQFPKEFQPARGSRANLHDPRAAACEGLFEKCNQVKKQPQWIPLPSKSRSLLSSDRPAHFVASPRSLPMGPS